MRAIAWTIPGKPVPLERPRRGKYGNFYTPEKSKAYQEAVGFHSIRFRDTYPKDARCHIWLRFYGKKDSDIDNCIKAVLDGLTKIGVWTDDSQVWAIDARWHEDDQEKVEVMIEDLA